MQCPSCGHSIGPMMYRCGHCGAEQPPPDGLAPAYEPLSPVPVRRMAPTDDYAQWTIAGLWVVGLLNAGAWVVIGARWPWRVEPGPFGFLDGAPSLVVVLLIIA